MTLFGNGVVHAAEEASCTQQLPGSGQRPPGSLPPAGPVCLLARHLGAAPLCLPHGVVFFALKPQLLRLWETSVGKLWGNFRPQIQMRWRPLAVILVASHLEEPCASTPADFCGSSPGPSRTLRPLVDGKFSFSGPRERGGEVGVRRHYHLVANMKLCH